MLEWKKWGCTLICDGWINGKDMSVSNFLVYSQRAIVFLKFVYSSDVIKDAKLIFELFYSIVEETMDDNVVQIAEQKKM